MLRTGMKNYNSDRQIQEDNTETESQTTVDNGVQPLHWDTSPGPSPIGTDPINGF